MRPPPGAAAAQLVAAAPTAEQVAHRLWAAGVLPVLRAADPDAAAGTARQLAGAGVSVVELTTTIPEWADLLRQVRATLPELMVGMGTVLTEDDAQAAVAAGAHFLVSPFPVPAVRTVSAGQGRLLIEGGFTPGEVAAAASNGLAKLFPAHVGGPAYLKSLLAVVPGARIIPTGGISLDAAEQWLRAGAFAVGVGGGLLDGGLPDAAARLARYTPRPLHAPDQAVAAAGVHSPGGTTVPAHDAGSCTRRAAHAPPSPPLLRQEGQLL